MTDASLPIRSESQEERIERLRAYLADHPGTRLMDLKEHIDAERGPLYITARRLKERGELLEHPRTGALLFPGQASGKVAARSGANVEKDLIRIRALQDIRRIALSRDEARAFKKGEEADVPPKIAEALIKGGVAERVELKVEAAPELVPAETALERRPEHPAVAEAASINEFLKVHREQGAEAAVAFKREEEAPRVQAQLQKREEQQRSDEELLRSGGWWSAVDEAIDEFLAGEPMLRKIIVYSALSAGLGDKQLHLMAIGDSQVGKSYALRSIGTKLFPDIFIDVASMSGKGPYYVAKDANDPRYFYGKILLIDELADQSEATLDFMKAGMSPGVKRLTHVTVDEHRRSSIMNLYGVPVFWSTSAEVLEDPEGQLMNRPFVVNPDESAAQTRKIMEFQREAASISLVKVIDSKIPRARRLLERILEEKEPTIYNLFTQHIRISEDDSKARNTLPMFFNLVRAVAYANRFARPIIELSDGRKLLFASYQDNVEAAELWEWASGPKSTGLPNRHLELLSLLPVYTGVGNGRGLELDEIVELYNKRTGRNAAHKTVLNYLSQLSSKDKATYYDDDQGRHLWYSTAPSQPIPSSSHLLIGMESEEGNKLLDEQLEALRTALSQLPTETELQVEGLRKKVLEQGADRRR